MSSTYYPVERLEFEQFICDEFGFAPAPSTGTLVYERTIKSNYLVRVWSSISSSTGKALDKGETAIRVVILRLEPSGTVTTGFPWGYHPKAGNGQKSAIWTSRTVGWKQNLWRCIRQAVAAVLKAPTCPECKAVCEPKQTRDGQRWWWGCGAYHQNGCRGSRGDLNIQDWKAYLEKIKDTPVPDTVQEDVVLGYWLNRPASNQPQPAQEHPEPAKPKPTLLPQPKLPSTPALLPVRREPTLPAPASSCFVPGSASDPTRPVINILGFDLNQEQADVVQHERGPLLVPAAAGSGKSRCVVLQVAQDILVRGVNPGSIVVFSMTNKAVSELQERFQKVLGGNILNYLSVTTIHSFCWRWLKQIVPNKRYEQLLGAREKLNIASLQAARVSSTRDLVKVLLKSGVLTSRRKEGGRWIEEPVLDELGHQIRLGEPLNLQDPDPRPFVSGISLLHAYCIDPTAPDSEILKVVARLKDPDVSRYMPVVFRAYERAKEFFNVIGFEDMITLWLKEVAMVPERIALMRQRFAGRIVTDEGQDSSKAQQNVALALASGARDGEWGNLTFVGDVRQSMFSFAGAFPKTFLDFSKITNAKVIPLKVNYRSTRTIVQMGRRLSEKNAYGLDEEVFWTKPEEECVKPRISCYQDQNEEAATIAQGIFEQWEETQFSQLFPFREHMVAARTNAQLGPIQVALMSRGLPYVVPNSNNFFDLAVIKKCLAYLKCVAALQAGRYPSGEDLGECCDLPRRGLGEVFKNTIRTWPGNTLEGCRTLASRNWRHSAAEGLASLIEEAAFNKKKEPLNLQESWAAIQQGALRDLMETEEEETTATGDTTQECLIIFSDVIADFKWKETAVFLDMATKAQGYSIEDEKENLASRNAVIVSTVHRVKGGEAETVYGIGIAEGALPHKYALKAETNSLENQDCDEIKEERNIMYVLITRAKKNLHLSWPRLFHDRATQPSRFLAECLAAGEGLEEYLELLRNRQGRRVTKPTRTEKEIRSSKDSHGSTDLTDFGGMLGITSEDE